MGMIQANWSYEQLSALATFLDAVLDVTPSTDYPVPVTFNGRVFTVNGEKP